jgi:regulator of protease activity HflC (stomatin/prohibitin superfamily)
MGTNAKKEKFDATLKTLTEAARTKNGKIVGIIVVAVLLLNVIILNSFGTTLENKITAEIQALKTELAGTNAQVADLEKEIDQKTETLDIEAFKAEAESIKKAAESVNDATGKASENFDAKLNALLKAEEAKLEILTKDLETHKAYIDELKNLLAGKDGQ